MNGLELVVDQCKPDQLRILGSVVDVPLHFPQCICHGVDWWWNIRSLIQGAACRADPVLCGSEFAWCCLLATHALHEVAVQLTDCLLYTSDAADDLLCVDVGGRRIIKKKKK